MAQSRQLTVVAAALLLGTVTGATQSLPTSKPAGNPAASIDRALMEAVQRKEIPGVVAMATDRQRVIY